MDCHQLPDSLSLLTFLLSISSELACQMANLKEKEHNKAFYQLCCHMEPAYHQLEFDLRLWLTERELNPIAGG